MDDGLYIIRYSVQFSRTTPPHLQSPTPTPLHPAFFNVIYLPPVLVEYFRPCHLHGHRHHQIQTTFTHEIQNCFIINHHRSERNVHTKTKMKGITISALILSTMIKIVPIRIGAYNLKRRCHCLTTIEWCQWQHPVLDALYFFRKLYRHRQKMWHQFLIPET